jgi:PAS domain S-box-containing protein
MSLQPQTHSSTQRHPRRTTAKMQIFAGKTDSAPEPSAHSLQESKNHTDQLRAQVALLDLTHETILVRDMEGRILFWNHGAEEMYGWSREEALGSIAHALLKTSYPQSIQEIVTAVIGTGRWDGELIHTTRDGHKIVVDSRWALQCDTGGKPIAVLEINCDITERKRAEEELIQAKDELEKRVEERTTLLAEMNTRLFEMMNERRVEQLRLKEVITHARCILWKGEITGNKGWRDATSDHCFAWNINVTDREAAQRFLPLHVREGETYAEALNASRLHEDTQVVAKTCAAALRSGSDSYVTEYRCINKHGEEHWMREEVVLDQKASGYWQVFGVCTDITEAKQAELRLHKEHELLNAIVEGTTDNIFVKDLQGRYLSINTAGAAMLGHGIGEIIGKDDHDIFPPTDAANVMAHDQIVIATGEPSATERDINLNGATRTLFTVKTPYRDKAGKIIGLIGIARDITERNRQEQARLVAEAASRAKDRFLAMLSHELRTPLTPVLMTVHTLLADKRLSRPLRTGLEMIRRNVEVEAHLINDLLDVSRILHGKFELNRTPCDLHDPIRQAVEICRSDFETKGVRLSVRLSAQTTRKVSGDPSRLQQVFWNLLKNASKFTPTGGTVWLRSRDDGNNIIVEVADTGIGIPAESLSKIFDPFEQVGQQVQTEGLGLGLAISKGIVDAHSGVISVANSEVGSGTVFKISLPTNQKFARKKSV